ncbi:hypothetical protein SBA1_400030 [Candidatus Sulfotelmatobacter kueseliae]|uniref:Uncharacterized protein n=1 Tax=Candidatus Sulfotelmatobacter kueseliae TaxID=2042962 RepID=A0A2U3KQD8_9BACT|nr:hypothetical protein SBA1_400030 [Candidatus Sulfotelmatobacter kueseliae]
MPDLLIAAWKVLFVGLRLTLVVENDI